MKLWQKISLLAINFTPLLVFAKDAEDCPPKSICGIIAILTKTLNQIIPLLVGVGLVVFIWGIIQYITAAGETEKRREGIQFMVWGLIGLFVIVSVWALVNVLVKTFDLSGNLSPNDIVPKLLQ